MANLTDNDLIQIFLPIIKNGLTADGFTGVVVQQAAQPTMQGSPIAPTVYFYKVGMKRYGYLGRSNRWDSIGSEMDHTESQFYESTWRIQSMVLQNPATPNQYTASDLADEVASIMQSDSTLDILNSNGIGILRITDIVNPYFMDDRDNYEAIPSFDFTLIYENERGSVDPIISQFTSGIYPI